MIRHALALLLAAAPAPYLAAQPVATPEKPLFFEVASLKPAAPGQQGGIIRPMRGNQSYVANNMPLRALIRIAYGVSDRQLSGGPDWVNTTLFDMDGKAEKPATIDELHLMLRSLLEERFDLKVHREAKEQSVFALVVDKGGPKMTVHQPVEPDYPPISGGGLGPRTARNAVMSYFAFYLSQVLDKWVIDRTGLTDRYDFTIQWVPERPPRPPGATEEAPLPEGPTIFAALKEQLGLRLDAARGPVEYLVIDSIHPLKEN
jgi:uncharacterized protein (TIGR03435 family)